MVTTATTYICQEGTNSPAATPEIVDLELDSAQFLKVGEAEEEKIKEKTVMVEEADKESNEAVMKMRMERMSEDEYCI